MSAEINALKSRVGDLKRQLREAEDRLRAAEIDAFPVKVGDVVSFRGKDHRVCEVIPKGYTTWLMGNQRKKDGSWSEAVHHLYSDYKTI